MNNLLKLIATFFNVGKFPKAPGTIGTLAAVPLFVFMTCVLSLQPLTYMVCTFLICLIGIFAAQAYESDATEHDSKEIVIDEVAGFLITMALVPCNYKTIIAGFVLFRFFDILKPWPISYLDKNVKGGVGVMVDDIAAGIAASLCLQGLLNYFPQVLA